MAKYQSTHTGAEIDAGIDLLDKNSATEGQVLTANGTGGASWQNASGGGTEVVANPTLTGTETELTGLEVAGTKYKVPTSGGGGGASIGGGYTVTTNQRFGSGTFLILGKYENVFGWHAITVNDMHRPVISNAVMICPLTVDHGATEIQSTPTLYDFSGTLNQYSNLTLNKMYYIKQDTTLTITD